MIKLKNLRKQLLTKPVNTSISSIPKDQLLSGGADLLNLSCTGRTAGAYAKGHYYNLVGDSDTGKTVEGLTVFAEASINPNFDGYSFVHDDPEEGSLMDKAVFFGEKAAERIEPPARNKDGSPKNSDTVDEFYDNVLAAIARGPCIYLLDSMDVLDTMEDQAKDDKRRRAKKKDDGTKVAGSYGTSKPKMNKAMLRKLLPKLKANGSMLFIISQTIDKIGGFGFGPQKTKAGGHALKFCATLEIWMTHKKKLTRRVGKKDRKVGIITKVRIQKNRMVGRDRTIELSIYNTVGIDNTGSNINFLISEGHWTGNETSVTAPEFKFKGLIEDLVKKIEDKNLESKLRKLVASVWKEIDRKCSVQRKPRYI